MAAVELARSNGMLVSYDANVRLRLWQSEAACQQLILNTVGLADIFKVNREELSFLAGSADIPTKKKAEEFRRRYNLPLLLVTLDSEGALIIRPSGSTLVPAFDIELIEATGAGDAFDAGIISGLVEHLEHPNNRGQDRRKVLEELTEQQLVGIVRTANAIGALACTKAGAMTALPTKGELAEFLAKQP